MAEVSAIRKHPKDSEERPVPGMSPFNSEVLTSHVEPEAWWLRHKLNQVVKSSAAAGLGMIHATHKASGV